MSSREIFKEKKILWHLQKMKRIGNHLLKIQGILQPEKSHPKHTLRRIRWPIPEFLRWLANQNNSTPFETTDVGFPGMAP